MSSVSEIELVDDERDDLYGRRKTLMELTLITGIVLIVLFLVVFVFQFPRILSIAGKPHHAVPLKLQQVANSSPSP